MKKLLFSFFLMVLLMWSGTISEMQAQTWNQILTPRGWSLNSNWLPDTGYPNAIDATANLTNNVTTDPTVVTLAANNGSTAGNVIVGTLNIGDSDGTAAINVGGGTNNRVIFDVSSGSAALNLTSSAKGGGHQISASLQLNSNLVVTINRENASFSFNHMIFDAAGDKTLTLTSTVTKPNPCNFGAGSHATDGKYEFAKVIISGNFSFNNTRSDSDRAFGKELSSYVADAITLDAGILQSGTDAGNIISVNRGITLGAGGGTFHSPGGNRKWEVNSIITGSGGLTISDIGRTTLMAANTYTGTTSIKGGSLILGATGSINATPQISIAAGATFDVSAIADYTLSNSTTLSAAGAATAATIKGGNAVNLGSQAIELTYTPITFEGDLTRPALTISQGALILNNNTISVNNASGSALGEGTYRLIEVTGGSITGTPNASVTVTGNGLASGKIASLAVSGGYLNMVVATDTGTGVDKSNSDAVSVYVNSGNQLIINGQEESNYTVYNAMGAVVEQGFIKSQRHISSAILQPGLYVVRINNLTKKIVVNQ
jgi:fibronectin-binding autotransporter adhesin